MINREIYTCALGLMGDDPTSPEYSDYEKRAPYIIASFCCSAMELDKKLRKRDGLDEQHDFNTISLPLSALFPLCDKFSVPAALYTASMLVLDENPELGDALYDKYCDKMGMLGAELESFRSAVTESIRDAYSFDL